MTLQLLLQRFIALSLLLTTLTACSSADGATPSPTQTPILATPTHTATFTPSPTDTPTPTSTPTEIPSALSLMAVWNPDKPGGMTEADFPMFDMANAGAAIDERLAQLQYNEADGSSTLNGEVLFAADAPKAIMQEPMPGRFIFRPGVRAPGWYRILSVYKADSAHGAVVEGTTEYRAQIAINTEDGPVIQDIIIGANNDNWFKRLRIDFALSDLEYAYFNVYPDTSVIGKGADDLHYPPLIRGFYFDTTTGTYQVKPEFVEFFEQIKQGKLIQMHIPIPGIWSTG